jgi:hypothetical protein
MTAIYQSQKHLLIVVRVDNSLGPLASLDATVEKDIDLTVRAALELRQPDPRHDEAHKARASPDITTFSAKVSFLQ